MSTEQPDQYDDGERRFQGWGEGVAVVGLPMVVGTAITERHEEICYRRRKSSRSGLGEAEERQCDIAMGEAGGSRGGRA